MGHNLTNLHVLNLELSFFFLFLNCALLLFCFVFVKCWLCMVLMNTINTNELLAVTFISFKSQYVLI